MDRKHDNEKNIDREKQNANPDQAGIDVGRQSRYARRQRHVDTTSEPSGFCSHRPPFRNVGAPPR
jgi:hypothetical protein